MKYSLALIAFVAFACSPPKESASTSDTTTVAPDTAVVTSEATQPSSAESNTAELSMTHKERTVTVNTGGYNLFSFQLPDSAQWDFSREDMEDISGKWEPVFPISYKAMYFNITNGHCSYPADEGTSTMPMDSVMGEGNIKFFHGTFDNRAAGTDGVEEIYDIEYKGNCVRFAWILDWSTGATEEQKAAEFRRMEAFLRSVHFEVSP